MARQGSSLLNPIAQVIWFFTCGCFVAALVVIAGTKLVNPQLHPDPFLFYEAILVRQSVDHSLCAAQWQDNVSGHSVCKIEPTDGIFEEVNLLTCDCDPPTFQIAFWPKRLQIADLVRRWGRPDAVSLTHNGHQYLIQWQNERVEAYAFNKGRYTYQAHLQLVVWHG